MLRRVHVWLAVPAVALALVGLAAPAGAATLADEADIAIVTPHLQYWTEPSGPVEYLWFSVYNYGPSLSHVTLTVTGMAAGLTKVTGGNGCNLAGSTVTCDMGNVGNPGGQPGGRMIAFTMPGNKASSLRFTISAHGPYPDPKPGNNTISVGPYSGSSSSSNSKGHPAASPAPLAAHPDPSRLTRPIESPTPAAASASPAVRPAAFGAGPARLPGIITYRGMYLRRRTLLAIAALVVGSVALVAAARSRSSRAGARQDSGDGASSQAVT